MPSGIVLRWITPAYLNDPSLRIQRARIPRFFEFIRELVAQDENAPVGDLISYAYADAPRALKLLEQRLSGGSFLVLAFQKRKVVGALQFKPHTSDFSVTNFTVVLPSHRQLHIGRNLSLAVVRFARNRGGALIDRSLVNSVSRAWHEKWSQKPARVRKVNGKIQPIEEVVYRPDLHSPSAKILVFASPKPFPGSKNAHMEPPRRRKKKIA